MNNYVELLSASLIASCLTFFIIQIIPTHFKKYFGLCVSNEKTSIYHDPLLRGIGIIFPLILIINTSYFETPISNIDALIIIISSLVGFWDDKFLLNQKSKFFIFFILGLFYSYYINVQIDLNFYEFIINAFIFLFLVLFFNQIDGINGLATLTFLTTIIFLSLFLNNIFLLLPVIFSVIAYLSFNVRGKVGIQGDTGSFFMGSLVAVLYFKIFKWYEFGILIFILLPILLDICSTTLVRIFLGMSILVGHKNNLYQKLVAKYKKHIFVSLGFVVIQIIFCFIMKYLLNSWGLKEIYFIIFITISLTAPLFLYLSYLIHKNKFLNY